MMSTAEEIMQEQLGSTLNKLAPNAHWRLSGPVGRARKCDIFKITNNMHTHTLALKIYRPNVTKARGAKTQFSALEKLRTNNHPSYVAAPHAYAFLPDANAFIMDWIHGLPLQSLLWRGALSPTLQLTLVSKVAQWLRHFHEHSGISHEAMNCNELLDRLSSRLPANSAQISTMKGAETFAAAYAYLQNHAANTQMLAPHALLHGDFTPTNMLIQGDEVIGIDIWGARRAPIYEDIARMLTYLCINSPHALKRAPLIAGDQPTELFTAFSAGYGHDFMHYNTPALWYIMLYQHLRRWLVFLNWKKQGRSAIKAKLEAQRVCSLTQQILTHIQTQF